MKTKPVNAEWLKKNFPCYWACPVHTEAGRYVNLIAQGRFEDAYRLARAPNPFASLCGRICGAPCETACRRGELDKPIAIRALKRFVCERYGVESMIDIRKIYEALGPRIKPKDRWVAIIGSGPAGMSCAHDLALLGYKVTVFEKHDVPGGMLTLGVPEYRLPRELVRMEINAILNLGVELQLGKGLGVDFSLRDLKENGYEAVFLAIGAHKSRDLQIEGVELDGVLRGVDFLLNINLGYKVDLGKKILVIGGGNVAIDVARTAARQERVQEVASDITQALDVARSAVRFGAKEVNMVVLESREEMLATEEEIQEAQEERIQIHNSLGPKRIVGKNGRVSGLETIRCVSVFDPTGRFDPQFESGTERILDADSIIMAIGQTSDLSFLHPEDGVEITPRNTIKIDPETFATTAAGIYAGGDVCFGPRLAIDAIADGRRVARSIDEFLTGQKHEDKKIHVRVYDTYEYEQQPDFEKVDRVAIPALPIDRRVGVAQVELGYTEEQAVLEARRCLRCWINTVFDGREETGSECILCGGCVDICPQNCIALVSLHRLVSDPETMAELEHSQDFLLGRGRTGTGEEVEGAVMLKDETICIRCGLCAKRCPVDCIKMEGFEIEEKVAYEG
ncbi:MAG: FAD-dependent oxidoreductase [bacterium]